MKIITCYKCVPDEQDIAINNADGTLDFSKADSKISQYDLNAIEAACQLKQQLGDAQVVAMSVGGKALTNAKGRKDVLSRGPDELIVVIDDQFEQALPQQTASALAAAAQKSGFRSTYLRRRFFRSLCSAGWFAGGRSAEHSGD
ncbi:hypothetical protein SEEC5569_15235 [Salmonella enterica subsp. enterica serovar Cerro str. 5569]|nr:hypothetical protein SEEC5569_15235 [Salmonella enterica subsp. enterica serovar Cerro str. 5569]